MFLVQFLHLQMRYCLGKHIDPDRRFYYLVLLTKGIPEMHDTLHNATIDELIEDSDYTAINYHSTIMLTHLEDERMVVFFKFADLLNPNLDYDMPLRAPSIFTVRDESFKRIFDERSGTCLTTSDRKLMIHVLEGKLAAYYDNSRYMGTDTNMPMPIFVPIRQRAIAGTAASSRRQRGRQGFFRVTFSVICRFFCGCRRRGRSDDNQMQDEDICLNTYRV